MKSHTSMASKAETMTSEERKEVTGPLRDRGPLIAPALAHGSHVRLSEVAVACAP